MQLHQFLELSAKKFPKKDAVWFQDNWYSFAEINKRSDQIADFLFKFGIKKQDRIAVLLDNSVDYIAIYFGILKTGAVVVGLNSDISLESLLYSLNDSNTRILFSAFQNIKKINTILNNLNYLEAVVFNCAKDKLNDININKKLYSLTDINDKHKRSNNYSSVRTIDLDLAEIAYTSGSTGRPKGVMLTHLNLVSNMNSIIKYLKLSNKDRIMVILPFFYIYGKSLLLTHFLQGGSVVIDNRFLFPNKVLETMVKTEVTGFAGVPSTFSILLNRSMIRKYKFPSLRYVTQAGGAMSVELQKEVYDLIKPAKLFIMYGATEASPRLTYLNPKFFKKKIGSIGKPVDNVDVFIANDNGDELAPNEIGEIAARGSNIMAGYWNDQDSTKEVLKNGLYFTGDLGKMDDEGFLYVVGRKKDIIKVKGYRVSAKEIEESILKHEAVLESAVIGVNDEILGEAVKAYIVLKNETSVSEEDIKNFLLNYIAVYMIPKYIEFCKKLPKNEAGKIMKSELINKKE
ncbi:MAG: AMP-binding protein [Spirochaetes bacterium]|nr:AMP-binding protein [Spirochaetota bacterium]